MNQYYSITRDGELEVTSCNGSASRILYSSPNQINRLFVRDYAHQLIDLRQPPIFTIDCFFNYDVVRLIAEVGNVQLFVGRGHCERPNRHWRFELKHSSNQQCYNLAKILAQIDHSRKSLLVDKSLKLVLTERLHLSLTSLQSDFWG